MGRGEAVGRDYVSGKISGKNNYFDSISMSVKALLEPFSSEDLSNDKILDRLKRAEPGESELPLLCAVETAMLDLMCKTSGADIYDLLGSKPLRVSLSYGGTLPLLPQPAAEKLLGGYKQLGITNLRVKISNDPEYNRKTLQLVRTIMGEEYDLKVDTNAGWSYEDALINLPLLKEFGIRIIEEPFGRENIQGEQLIKRLNLSPAASGIVFMADESALTINDIRSAAAQKTFGMINIRLAKNGGLLKALELAKTADSLGLRYMAGCHVGETGILSAAGRAAASLMNKPEYVDGSYDSHLLSGNITTEDLSFGFEGKADIIRNNNLGFRIDKHKLEGFTDERIRCF
jgi:muconate cycloisomerase